MDLSDALSGWGAPGGNNQSQGQWPGGQNNNPWPGNPNQPASAPQWPAQPGQPGPQPSWPGQSGQSGQPAAPSWPGQPGQPAAPSWPGQPGQPAAPSWPSQPNPAPSGPGSWPSPAPGPGPAPATGPAPAPSFPVAPQQSLKMPYSQALPKGVYDKLLITIGGTVLPHADKITLDMNAGRDLAFHLNPRFNEGGKKVIVRNSRIGNKWGKEEREAGRFPFTPGRPFEMKILCTNSGYKVAVDGSHLLEFQHRVRDLRSVNSFTIHNDVTLSKVLVETVR